MLHNEHLRKANESYEVKHDDKGNALHVYIDQYQKAYLFSCLNAFVGYVYFGEESYFAVTEDRYLQSVYELETFTPSEITQRGIDKGIIQYYNEEILDKINPPIK